MSDLKGLYADTLLKIAEKKIGRPLTADEATELNSFIEDTQVEPSPEDEYYEYNEDIRAILRKETIEHLGHDIRMVVVGYIEICKQPFPYIVKKHLPFIRNSHMRILKADPDTFREAIEYAYKDMFVSDFCPLDYVDEHRSFFQQYTSNPVLFDVASINGLIPYKYRPDIENLF